MFKTLEKSSLKDLPKGSFTVIVPYRDQPEQNRAQQLDNFITHFSTLGYPVLIVEQTDEKKFNRGKLLNAGADLVETDYMIFHDVDLLPKQSILPYYTVFPSSPIHIGKAWREKYDSQNFLGGVVSVSKRDFQAIDGFPNNFWGWGGEDDAMRVRFKKAGLKVLQPSIKSGFTEQKHVDTKSKPEWKNMERWEGLDREKEGSNKSGLSNLEYNILEQLDVNPSTTKVVVNI
jgi:hypothetical protein